MKNSIPNSLTVDFTIFLQPWTVGWSKYWKTSMATGIPLKTSSSSKTDKNKAMKTKEFETITLKQLKKIARIFDDVAIPCSEERLIYYRLFGDGDLVTNNQTILLTKEQYKH